MTKSDEGIESQMLALDIIQAQLEQSEALMQLKIREYELQQAQIARLQKIREKLEASVKKALHG